MSYKFPTWLRSIGGVVLSLCLISCQPVLDQRQVVQSIGNVGVAFNATVIGSVRTRVDNTIPSFSGVSATTGEFLVVDGIRPSNRVALIVEAFFADLFEFLSDEAEQSIRSSVCVYFLEPENPNITKVVSSNLFLNLSSTVDVGDDPFTSINESLTDIQGILNNIESLGDELGDESARLSLITVAQICDRDIYSGAKVIVNATQTSATLHVTGTRFSNSLENVANRLSSNPIDIPPNSSGGIRVLGWSQCRGSKHCRLSEALSRGSNANVVYVLWHSGPKPHAIVVGYGPLGHELYKLRNSKSVNRFESRGELFITHATVTDYEKDGVIAFLNGQLQPYQRGAVETAPPIAVNLPF